jgi:GNAT superfamily N-acetyltransferase
MHPDEVAHLAVTTTLADGSVLSLRPIRPEDGPLLAEGFSRLSPESRFLRFFSPLDHLSEAQLRYFTEIDYVDHFAWVATVRTAKDPALGVAVARYIRSKQDPTAAEAAVAVADDHHRRGIGSIMLEALAAVALSRGITAFHLLVRADNHAMIAAMHELGAQQRPNDDPGVIRFVLDLPSLAHDVRGTPMWKVFRLVGAGSAQVQSSVGERLLQDPPDEPNGSTDRPTRSR